MKKIITTVVAGAVVFGGVANADASSNRHHSHKHHTPVYEQFVGHSLGSINTSGCPQILCPKPIGYPIPIPGSN